MQCAMCMASAGGRWVLKYVYKKILICYALLTLWHCYFWNKYIVNPTSVRTINKIEKYIITTSHTVVFFLQWSCYMFDI